MFALAVMLVGLVALLVANRARMHARSPAAVLPAQLVPGPRLFEVPAVGEASYVPAFATICGPRTERGVDREVVAELVAEPFNRFDSNAVMVRVEGRTVGYLSRDDAITYVPMVWEHLERRTRPSCRAVFRGGWDDGAGDRGYHGIWLDLPLLDTDGAPRAPTRRRRRVRQEKVPAAGER